MSLPFRRVKPAPYSRDSVSLDRHGKQWCWLYAYDLNPGDILQDFGKVREIVNHGEETEVIHSIYENKSIFINNDKKVYAFTAKT